MNYKLGSKDKNIQIFNDPLIGYELFSENTFDSKTIVKGFYTYKTIEYDTEIVDPKTGKVSIKKEQKKIIMIDKIIGIYIK